MMKKLAFAFAVSTLAIRIIRLPQCGTLLHSPSVLLEPKKHKKSVGHQATGALGGKRGSDAMRDH
jgi:hypothetical protein